MAMRWAVAAGVVLVAALAGACGSVSAGDGDPPAVGAPVPGGGLTVEQALAYEGEEPIMVTGMAYDAGDGQVRLCAAILESFPPQCGEPSLRVEGVDVADLDGAQHEGAVAWAEGASLLGRVRDSVLTVSEESL